MSIHPVLNNVLFRSCWIICSPLEGIGLPPLTLPALSLGGKSTVVISVKRHHECNMPSKGRARSMFQRAPHHTVDIEKAVPPLKILACQKVTSRYWLRT